MEEYENFDAMHETARRLVERWEREETEETPEDGETDEPGAEAPSDSGR